MWISKRSSIRCRCSRSCHSMDSILSVQNKDFTRDGKESTKVCRAVGKAQGPSDSFFEFGKACEELSWNRCTSTPHRFETNGIAERAVVRIKEGTTSVLLQPGLGERWWSDSMECYCYLRNVQDLLAERKTPYERRFGEPLKGPAIPSGAMVEYHPISPWDQAKNSSIWQESVTKDLSTVWTDRGVNLEKRHSDCGFGTIGSIRNLSSKNQRERSIDKTKKMTNSFSQQQMVQQNCQEETTNSENPLEGGNRP